MDTDKLQFTVTDDHLRLARCMWVGWCDDEYGAPEIDPKRPYGNSNVADDIREIVDPNLHDDEAYELHHEMQTVLQIALTTGSFRPGVYEADKYRQDWTPVS